MIIYRIFFGFCGVCLWFLYIYVYGSKACAALHLGHSSCQLCSDTPTGTSSSFFALRKTPFHSRLYCSGVSLFHLYTSPLQALVQDMDEQFSVCSLLFIHSITFPLPPLRHSLAWKLSSVSVFYQVPILYRDSYLCVQGESPSRLGHFPSPLRIRRHFALPFRWKPDGTVQRWKLQHTGELFETYFWCRKSSLKTWLIQSSNLNSHDAVLDLFNFCIVLYVRLRYFLEFTFAILGSVLLAKKLRELLETNGEKCVTVFWRGYLHGWITLGVFWGVCTCSNSIYTTIPMPLYSYLVSPVSWNLENYS